MNKLSFEPILDWVSLYSVSLILTVLVLLAALLINRFLLPRIESGVNQSKFKSEAKKKAYHTVKLVLTLITIAVLLIVWGIDFSGLLLISTSLITLTGVALFASWSLLSNVTSYFVLLFHNSFRRGNFIRVIDTDNYMEGFISEVNLFNTKIITEDREIIVYPNNLILTRPCIVNPRARWKGIGKIADRDLAELSINEVKADVEEAKRVGVNDGKP
jgi:small-conductance mechanosensitive channel